MKPVDLLLGVTVMLVWGANFIAAKLGVGQLPPILLMSIRFAAVAALLLPFARLPRGRLWRIAALSVTLGCIHFACMFTGLRDLDAGTAAILTQTQVPFAAALAAIVYRERLGWMRALGMAVAFAGVALMVGEPRLTTNLRPVGLVLFASFLWAASNIQIKLLGPINGTSLNAYLALFAAPQLLIASFVLESHQGTALATADWSRVIFSVLYMAVLTQIVSYLMWYRLLRRYPVNEVMPLTLLVPVFGVLSGVIFLDETLGWRAVLGGVATLAGVAIIVLRPPAPQKA
ncbi:MAG TPA: EamA family transporter [Alphaproteobacteria bacterium]